MTKEQSVDTDLSKTVNSEIPATPTAVANLLQNKTVLGFLNALAIWDAERIGIQVLNNACRPYKKHATDAGIDLRANPMLSLSSWQVNLIEGVLRRRNATWGGLATEKEQVFLDGELISLEDFQEAAKEPLAFLAPVGSIPSQWAESATNRCMLGTGVKMRLPDFGVDSPFEALVWLTPRSGLANKHGISIVNSPALADQGYRGEFLILLENRGSDFHLFSTGARIAQAVPSVALKTGDLSGKYVEFVDDVNETSSTRGEDGFGSTGLT